MAKKHTIEVEILAQTKKAAGALKQFATDSGLDKIANGAKTIAIAAGAAVAAAGVAAGAYVGDAIGKASNLEQSIGAIDAVFKESAGQMHEWANGAADAVGLTRNQYNELATVLGTQLKNGGTAIDEIGGKTNELVGLGADLASMFGGTSADAVGALSSALKGERDPIERYGVSLKQATIDAKAAEMGFEKVGGSLTNEAQQAATLALIMEQTADAHGNFAKEADTVQGKQARLSASWENLSAKIGTAFLPAVASIADWIGTRVMPVLERWGEQIATNVGPALEQAGVVITTQVLPALAAFGSWIQTYVLPPLAQLAGTIGANLGPMLAGLIGWLQAAQGWLIPLGAAVGAMVVAFQAWTTAVRLWRAITVVATAAQAILNAVLSANPIGLVVLAIVGLIAAGVALYKNNETVRRVIDAAWKAIRGAIDAVAGWITGTAIPAIRGAWDRLSAAGTDLKNKISSAFTGARDAVDRFSTNVRTVVGNVVGFFRDLPGKIGGALSGIGGRLADIGRNMITSLANALSPTAIINKLRGVIGDAIGFAKRLLGIASPSRVFADIGRQTGAGLEVGLTRSLDAVRRSAGNLARTVIDYGTPDPLAVALDTAGGGYGRGATVFAPVIKVSALYPTPETGRIIADAVEDVWNRRGKAF